MVKNIFPLLLLAGALLYLTGCDPLTRHKVVSTIFDGVPTMPSPEKYCSDYADRRILEMQQKSTEKKAADAKLLASEHQPYKDKECDGCHDKSKPDGLIVPKDKLCFECHSGFIKGEWVHGPVSIGDCLSCHEPHTAKLPKLLKHPNGKLCLNCHQEKRLKEGIHGKAAAREITCTDCHDPHAGNVRFFLK